MALLQVKSLADEVLATLTVRSVDEANADAVGKELYALADQLGERWLQLDLGGVTSMTSVGLGKMLSLYRRVLLAGGQLTFRNVRPEIYELFVVTRLTTILDIQPSATAASEPAGAGASPRMG